MTSTSANEPPLCLSRIDIDNYMRVEHVELQLTAAGLTVIAGENGNGKTSIFSAIKAALGGEDYIGKCPIRIGEEAADVIVLVSTQASQEGKIVPGTPVFKIHRKCREGGNYLEVTDLRNDPPTKVKQPQAVLRELLSLVSFRPMEFACPEGKTDEDKHKRRMEILLGVSNMKGYDIAKGEKLIEEAEKERLAATRAMKDASNGLKFENEQPVVPEVPVVDEKAISAAEEEYRKAERDAADIERAKEACERLKTEIADLEKALAAKKAELVGKTNSSHFSVPDVAGIRAKVLKMREDAAKSRMAAGPAYEARSKADLWKKAKARHEEWDGIVKRLRAEREAALAGAEFPLKNIVLRDEGTRTGIWLRRKDGSLLPFDQASLAQRLQASFVVMRAMNPRLRIALVEEGGNDMGEEALSQLARLATAYGYQVILERLTAGGAPNVVEIKEGRVAQ